MGNLCEVIRVLLNGAGVEHCWLVCAVMYSSSSW